ncbi:MAG: HAMP domain-containing histidine kinase [Lachnospiraceae bacterium]|nr:HAMP domain-containing histidine kinase [Lachnospiraceae bacterium]
MKKISLRLKLTVIFISLLAVTLALVYFLNSQFLDDFYYQNKTQSMVESYQTIQNMIVEGNYSSDEIELEMTKIRDKYNIAMLYLDADNLELVGNYASRVEEKSMTQKLWQYMLGSAADDVTIYSQPNDFENQVVYNDEQIQILETKEAMTQNTYLESWGLFDEKIVYVMSTPLESIQESVSIANRLLLMVGSAVLLLAVIILLVITRQVTKPILDLAEISEKMSHLDFQKRYTGKERDEIGILGNSINTMADRLQETIEELQEANEQLKRDIQEKVEIDEVRKEFLSNVSHELKTPIALIQGYAEGLQESVNDSPESRDFYCEVIMDEADKMNKMVRKLLTLNHLEFGKDVLDLTEFDIVALVQSVLGANAITLKQKEAQVHVNMPEFAVVVGDEFKIEEVVTNYLSNALNHLDYEREIEVSVTETEDKVRVSVYNSGNPIPEEDLSKIWDKFYKVDKAHTREYGGSGIGLSIVKAIMESQGEAYGVENCKNGVEFWFELSKVEAVTPQTE